MTSPDKKKFLVSYLIPAAVMDEWKNTDAEQRASSEKKMMEDWKAWTTAHEKMIVSTEIGCKTKRVTADGVADARNDIVISSIVEAESHDAAAKAFENHPHLRIPRASIEIMEVRAMGPM